MRRRRIKVATPYNEAGIAFAGFQSTEIKDLNKNLIV